MRSLNRYFPQGVAAIALIAALLASTFAPVAAADSRAGLVVAYGDGRVAYVVVEFAGDSISGVDLVDRSGLAVTEVSFGSLGVAICAVDETGCDVSECRKRLCQGPQRDDPYWQYFVAAGDGSWLVAPLGISGDSIPDGAVRAFIWSAGTPEFSALTIDALAVKAGPANADGVALTRYLADGSVDDGNGANSDADIPYQGIAVVVLAAVIAAGIYWRQAIGRRQ